MSANASRQLLRWYDRHRRRMPWRAPPGGRADPYHVWLSEVMLQQTTVATVGPYFEAFLARWPDVAALAGASLDEVLHAWQGLGYYARARNLHKCARVVAREHGGRFPASEEALLALPGIGPYTAAAIAAIAFDLPATPVDGNVERVMARIHAVAVPLPAAKPKLRELARALTPAARPGDYAQAVMDLGATVCTPTKPRCAQCPWSDRCAAHAAGAMEDYPVKAPKAERPTRRGVAYWIRDRDGAVFIRRRPENGLLGGMMEIPSTPWQAGGWRMKEAESSPPLPARLVRLPGVVRHTFTHFHLELKVLAGETTSGRGGGGLWTPVDRLGDYALPTVMKKVVRHALKHTA